MWLEECFYFAVILRHVFESHAEVQVFWLVQACLPSVCAEVALCFPDSVCVG